MNEIQEQASVAKKHPGGRPRKYSTPEEMQKAIDAYFQDNERRTVTGLALHLGFTSRADLIRYEGYSEEYHYALKRAKLKIEAYYEEHLVESGAGGSIFALKNFGWSDKHEIEQNVRVDTRILTIDEIKARIQGTEESGDGIATD
jgi:hypothetical protein